MEQRRLIGLVTASAVVATGAAVIALNWPVGSAPGPAGAAVAAPPPIEPELSMVDLAPSAGPGPARALDLPRRGTKTFTMLGISWTDPDAAPRGTLQVRTRSVATGGWSGWRSLDTDDSHGPDTGAEARRPLRGGTGPLWVGPANGVAARIVRPGGSATTALPAGIRLDLIDSRGTGGQGGGDVLDPSVGPSTVASASPSPSAPGSPGVTRPAIRPASPPVPPGAHRLVGPVLPDYVTRAGWRADESIVTDPPAYAPDVKVLFVHHTAGTNDYACADSPAIVRGILAYHVQVEGWSDIGYNFLVDKCGTLFEGRRGGVDKAVIGAHTYGFNTGSAGIAVLGTYTAVQVPAVTATVIAKVAAYKLGKYGYYPSGTAQLTEGVADGKFPLGTVVTFNRISGHRDAVATECPGDALYAQLSGIRSQASTIAGRAAVRPGSATRSAPVAPS